MSRRQQRIDRKAAQWALRLETAACRPAERRRFDRWLERSEKHRAAFAEAQQALAAIDLLATQQHPLSHSAEVTKFAPTPNVGRAGPGRRRFAPVLSGAALAGCLCLILAIGYLWIGNPLVLLRADVTTGPAEVRSVRLPDGSEATLGPETALAWDFGREERRVELLSGAAFFAVAPERSDSEGRPGRRFSVTAGAGTVTALGTRFLVSRNGERVEVAVAEHAVLVRLEDDSGVPQREGPSQRLSQGQALHYRPSGLGQVETVDPGLIASWRRGRLVFASVPLSEVVAELSRYRRGEILIANPTLAARRVSGVFSADDPAAVLATIARETSAEVVNLSPLVTLLY